MSLFERGSLTVGRIGGVPVRVHWTAPIGAYVFTGWRFDATAWLCFFGIVLAHEVGHALVVKAVRCRPVNIDLTGYGGLCYWRGDPTPIGRAAIAWGGVWAQLLLLALAEAYLAIFGMPYDFHGYQVLATLTSANVWMIAFNLMPLPPLDGAEAWRLPVLLGRALRAPPRSAVTMPAVRQDDRTDEAFEAGERRDEVQAMVNAMLDDARNS
jgi:Zn-dependent protease